MAFTTHSVSATIHQFPTRMRSATAAYEGPGAPVAQLRGPRLERMEFGSGWYHDAAMEEERQQSRERDDH